MYLGYGKDLINGVVVNWNKIFYSLGLWLNWYLGVVGC